ncbi:MAG: restriction endonuclease subunit S [Coriobacteriia bacterium]|nr:restriction endonuclease subunit S [Coriobacteriia bacterium]
MRKLSDIAEIQPGYSFRAAVETEPGGTIAVIQIKDISEFDFTGLPRISFSNPKFLLKVGDILIASRSNFKAALLQEVPIPCIIAASVLRIRVHNQAFSPLVLAALLNSTQGQHTLGRLAGGSFMLTLSKQELGAFPVPDISPEQQRQYACALNTIHQYQQALAKKQQLTAELETALSQRLLQEEVQ